MIKNEPVSNLALAGDGLHVVGGCESGASPKKDLAERRGKGGQAVEQANARDHSYDDEPKMEKKISINLF